MFKFAGDFYKIFRNNEEIKLLVKEAAAFYAKELGLKGVTINMRSVFPEKRADIHGYVQKHLYPAKEKEYDMTIHLNHGKISILETVAHEMIHVAQWERGDLQDFGYRRLWKGEDHTLTPYSKRPWEKEAFKKEVPLAKKFIKHKKIRVPISRKIIKLILPV